MAGAYPTVQTAVAAWTNDANVDVTTTVVRKTVPGGAAFLDIGLMRKVAAVPTALYLYVAINAVSDAEETAILAAAGPQRIEIPFGATLRDMQRIMAPGSEPITRYAFCTDAATESVGNRVVQRIGGLL